MLKEIDLGGVELQTFGLFFALNFLCWAAVAARRLKEIGKPPDWAYEILFVALVGGLIGARGYFLLQNWDDVKGDLFGNLFSGAGLIWYGGLIGGVVSVLIWAKWRGFMSLQLVDIAAIGLPLGYAIGRIGCQVSGDGDYGRASDLPWAMGYPHGAVPTAPGETVQPTPIYETLSMGLLAFVLWNLRDRFRPGVLFGFYLLGAGAEQVPGRVRAPQRVGRRLHDRRPGRELRDVPARHRLAAGDARSQRRPAARARTGVAAGGRRQTARRDRLSLARRRFRRPLSHTRRRETS